MKIDEIEDLQDRIQTYNRVIQIFSDAKSRKIQATIKGGKILDMDIAEYSKKIKILKAEIMEIEKN